MAHWELFSLHKVLSLNNRADGRSLQSAGYPNADDGSDSDAASIHSSSLDPSEFLGSASKAKGDAFSSKSFRGNRFADGASVASSASLFHDPSSSTPKKAISSGKRVAFSIVSSAEYDGLECIAMLCTNDVLLCRFRGAVRPPSEEEIASLASGNPYVPSSSSSSRGSPSRSSSSTFTPGSLSSAGFLTALGINPQTSASTPLFSSASSSSSSSRSSASASSAGSSYDSQPSQKCQIMSPILRYVTHFRDKRRKLISLTFDPQLRFLLCLTSEAEIYLIPLRRLLFGATLGLNIDPSLTRSSASRSAPLSPSSNNNMSSPSPVSISDPSSSSSVSSPAPIPVSSSPGSSAAESFISSSLSSGQDPSKYLWLYSAAMSITEVGGDIVSSVGSSVSSAVNAIGSKLGFSKIPSLMNYVSKTPTSPQGAVYHPFSGSEACMTRLGEFAASFHQHLRTRGAVSCCAWWTNGEGVSYAILGTDQGCLVFANLHSKTEDLVLPGFTSGIRRIQIVPDERKTYQYLLIQLYNKQCYRCLVESQEPVINADKDSSNRGVKRVDIVQQMNEAAHQLSSAGDHHRPLSSLNDMNDFLPEPLPQFSTSQPCDVEVRKMSRGNNVCVFAPKTQTLEVFDGEMSKFPLFSFQMHGEAHTVHATDRVLFSLQRSSDPSPSSSLGGGASSSSSPSPTPALSSPTSSERIWVLSRLLSGASHPNASLQSRHSKFASSVFQELRLPLDERVCGFLPSMVHPPSAPMIHQHASLQQRRNMAKPSSHKAHGSSERSFENWDDSDDETPSSTRLGSDEITPNGASSSNSNSGSGSAAPAAPSFMTLEGTYVWTEDSLYEIRQKHAPDSLFFQQLLDGTDTPIVEALGKTFSLDLLQMYEQAADVLYRSGEIPRSLHLYSLSNVSPFKLIRRYVGCNRMTDLVSYLSTLVDERTSSLPASSRTRLSDILFLVHLHCATRIPKPDIWGGISTPFLVSSPPAAAIAPQSQIAAVVSKQAQQQQQAQQASQPKNLQNTLDMITRLRQRSQNSAAAPIEPSSSSVRRKSSSSSSSSVPVINVPSSGPETSLKELRSFLLSNREYNSGKAVLQLINTGFTNLALEVANARNVMQNALSMLSSKGIFSLDSSVLQVLLKNGHAELVLRSSGGVFFRCMPDESKIRFLCSLPIQTVVNDFLPQLESIVVSCSDISLLKQIADFLDPRKASPVSQQQQQQQQPQQQPQDIPRNHSYSSIDEEDDHHDYDEEDIEREEAFQQRHYPHMRPQRPPISPVKSNATSPVLSSSSSSSSSPSFIRRDSRVVELFLRTIIRIISYSSSAPSSSPLYYTINEFASFLDEFSDLFRAQLLLREALDSENRLLSATLFDHFGEGGEALRCRFEEVIYRLSSTAGATGEQSSYQDLEKKMCTEMLRLFETAIIKKMDDIPEDERPCLLAQFFLTWSELRLPVEPLEMFLTKQLHVLGDPISVLLFDGLPAEMLTAIQTLSPDIPSSLSLLQQESGISMEMEENSMAAVSTESLFLPFSGLFMLRVTQHSIRKLEVDNRKDSPIGLDQYWRQILQNIEKDLQERPHILIPVVSATRLLEDPSKQAVVFSCGHAHGKRMFLDHMLPELVRNCRVLGPYPTTMRFLHAEYLRPFIGTACPSCTVEALRQEGGSAQASSQNRR